MKVEVLKINIADDAVTIEHLKKVIDEAVTKGAKTYIILGLPNATPVEISFIRDETERESDIRISKTISQEQKEAIERLYDIEINKQEKKPKE